MFNLRRDPANVVTWDNRDRIIVQDLEGLCAPACRTDSRSCRSRDATDD